jgi:hypothetical protein
MNLTRPRWYTWLAEEEKDLKMKQHSLAPIKIQRPLHLERIGKYLSRRLI